MFWSRSHTFAPWVEALRVAPLDALDRAATFARARSPLYDRIGQVLTQTLPHFAQERTDAALLAGVRAASVLWPAPSRAEPTRLRPAPQAATKTPPSPATPRTAPAKGATAPEPSLVYAIGDVHGRADLLDALLAKISGDAGERPCKLIMLGDYVDRGAKSREVIDLLLSDRVSQFETIYLKGNHEAALLRFLMDAGAGPVWCSYGGGATLLSYGVRQPAADAPVEDWEAARLAFEAAMPPAHRRFYEDLSLYAVHGDYVFVHAGVRPGIPLARQTESDLLWIRGEFLEDESPSEKIVVHGHTPESAPFRSRARIGIDTGAYVTGVLTAARLEARSVAFLQARA